MPAWLTKNSQNPTRDNKIVAYYKAGMNLREIGSVFSISHERVRQIIASFETKSQSKLERNHWRGERTERIIWRCASCGLERKMLASQVHSRVCSKCNDLSKIKYSDETISAWIAQRRSGLTWTELARQVGFKKNSLSTISYVVYAFLRRNNRLSEVAELWKGYSLRYLAHLYPKDTWLKESSADGRRTRRGKGSLDVFSRFIILHPQDGIYLGNAMGFGFFSRLDSVGQTSVTVFETELQATNHILSWESNDKPSQYKFVPIETQDSFFATISELKAAGLTEYLGDMEQNQEKYNET